MSPSPGTSRFGVESVPTAKSLTCTSRNVSTPSAIVARARARPSTRSSRCTRRRRVGGRGRRRRAACGRTRRRRAASSCARARTGCRRRTPRRAPVRSRFGVASAASSQVSCPAGPVVSTRHSASTVSAASRATRTRSRCSAHCAGSARLERAEADQVRHPQPGVADAAGALLPARRLELRRARRRSR